MDITIKPADTAYLSEYTRLLQHVYESAYTDNGLGLTKECFSKEVFNTKNTQDYLKSNLINSSAQKA